MIGTLAHVDMGRGIAALIISIALYVVVEHEQNPPEMGSFDLRVDLDHVPPGLLVVGDASTRAVEVRVSAPRDALAGLRTSSLRAYADLTRAAAGVDQYPVAVDLPDPKMRLVEVRPARISVRLDQNVDRQVQVKLNRIGAVPFGYDAGDPDTDPTVATVSGPASAVQKVDSVSVELKIDGVTSAIDARYPATAVDAQGQQVTSDGPALRIDPPTIRVRMPVTQQLSYKTVGVQPQIVGNVQSGYVIDGVTTEPSAVTIVGAPPALAGVSFAQTEQVDVSDATATFARQVSVIVPDNVSIVQDGTARVTVRVAPLSLTQSIAAIPTAENVTPGLQVVSAIPNIQIVMQGAPGAVRGLQLTDLHVSLNLAGLGAGPHQVQVDVTPPSGLTVQSVNPTVVNVTLAEVAVALPPVQPTPPPTATVPAAPPTPTATSLPTEEPPVPPSPTLLRPTPSPTITTTPRAQ